MRTNAHLSKKVMGDLSKWSGITFKYPDRLTREEAGRVRQWAEANPELVRASREKGHPDHGALQLYAGVVRHYESDHPQVAGGDPAPWPQRSPKGAGPTEADPLAGLHADEAEAHLAWLATKPEYREIMTNAKHPEHDVFVNATLRLRETVSGAPTPIAASPDAGRANGRVDTAFNAKLAELQADPAYMQKTHPQHTAAVEAVSALYRSAYPEPGAASPAPSQASPADAARARIRELEGSPAHMQKAHPDHATVMTELTSAYQQAHPEPVAGAPA